MEIDVRAVKLFAVFSVLNLSIIALTAVSMSSLGLTEGLLIFGFLMVLTVLLISRYYKNHAN